MVLDPAANFIRGQTDTQINDTNTTLSVTDATIFPDPSSDGEYNVVVWDADNHPRPDQDSDVEIMRVSARDTGANDLTVSRGQETTSGASHPSGAAVQLSPTAKMFGDIESTFNAFWDAGSSELTADVNNSSTVTIDIDSKYENAKRVVGTQSHQFQTIQAAHDDLPTAGGKIEVTSDYDQSNESYPVNINKPVWLDGQGASVELDGGSSDAINIDGDAGSDDDLNLDKQRFVRITNIAIVGGNDGIQIENAAFTRLEHVYIEAVSSNGVVVVAGNRSSNSNLYYDVHVENAGGDAIVQSAAANPHHTRVIACNLDNCGGGVKVRGRGSVISKTQIQGNDGRLELDNDTVRVEDCYIEDNDSANATDVLVSGGDGHVIRDCRFQGVGNNSRGITLNVGSTKVEIEACSYNGYTNWLNVNDGTDCDIHHTTHNAEDSSGFINNAGGTRLRSNGVIGGGPIGGVDISGITGATEGDHARTTGASAAGADVIAVFDGTDWVYPTRGGTVTPA